MKKIKFLVAVVAFVFVQSCSLDSDNDDDCDLCFTPPAPFVFDIVEEVTNVNVFTTGRYSSNDIEIVNTLNNSNVSFEYGNTGGVNLVSINSIGWQTEVVEALVELGGEGKFTLYVDAERKSQNCCEFTTYNEIRIEGAAYEFDRQTGIYTVVID